MSSPGYSLSDCDDIEKWSGQPILMVELHPLRIIKYETDKAARSGIVYETGLDSYYTCNTPKILAISVRDIDFFPFKELTLA